SAPVELIEYGDLTCLACKADAKRLVPQVIRSQVATGKARLTFRNFTIIGPESLPAGAAAIAAGEQGRGWDFIQIFLRNPTEENSGYVTDGFLESIAAAAGVDDLARWNRARVDSKTGARVKATTREAEHQLHLVGTPTFAIRGPRVHGLKVIGAPTDAAELDRA